MTDLVRILLTIIICGSCAIQEYDRSKVESEVKEMLSNYSVAIFENRYQGELEFLDDSPDFFWIPPGHKNPIGYDSVKSILVSADKRISKVENKFESLRVIPLSTEFATFTARINSKVTDAAGQTNVYLLHETAVVVKRNDGWNYFTGRRAC